MSTDTQDEDWAQKEEDLIKSKIKEGTGGSGVYFLYSYIDMMAPIGSRLHIEAFNTEEEAIARDQELEFGANKLKMIEDRKITPVRFTNGMEQFFLFRKSLLKKAKNADKKTKKKLDKLQHHERAIRTESLLPVSSHATEDDA